MATTGAGLSGWEKAILLANIGAGIFGGIGAGKVSKEQIAAQERIAAADRADRERLARMGVAADESMANPFRGQTFQANTLSYLDRLENAQYSKPQLNFGAGNKYAKYVPTVTGGFDYQMSPEMRGAAGTLKRSVLAGRTAPTMTDPGNYGQTGALDITNSYDDVFAPAGGGAGGTAAGARALPAASAYLAGVTRRGGGTTAGGRTTGALGGAASGAGLGSLIAPGIGTGIGAGVGALAGLFGGGGRRAGSAGSDLPVDTARTVLTNAYRDATGQTPTPQQIDQWLRGQGWQPGDAWVGEAGLLSVIAGIQQQRR